MVSCAALFSECIQSSCRQACEVTIQITGHRAKSFTAELTPRLASEPDRQSCIMKSNLDANNATPGLELFHTGSNGANTQPAGWIYRSRKVGVIKLPWYASPEAQLLMVAFVCFMCPGMFNALGGLGGGGQVDPTTADNTNVILYSVFGFFGFFAGTVCNRLGIKITISFGGFGYFMYSASFLSYNINQNKGFVYFAGALLGFCAALL